MQLQRASLAALVGALALASLAHASAIKGHGQARAHDEARSIKADKQAATKSAAGLHSPVQPHVAVLESSKKVYNDESIRRMAAAGSPLEQAPIVAAGVKDAHVHSPAPKVSEHTHVEHVKEAAPVPAIAPVAPAAAPATVVEAKSAPVEPKPAPVELKAAVVEPKSAPVEPKVAPVEQAKPVVVVAAAKPVDELPAQSDRSAPIRAEAVHVAAPVAAPVEQSAPIQSEASAPVPAAAPVNAPAPVVPEPLKDSPLMAKKDEVVPVAAPVAQPEPLHIETPVPDPGLVLSEPIDSTTKLLIDLDEHVQKFLPAEDQQQAAPAKDQALVAGVDYSPVAAAEQPSGKSSAPLVPYSSSSATDDTIVPPLPSLDGVEKASGSQPAGSPTGVQAAPTSASSSSSVSSATRQGGQHQNQQQVITQLLDQLDTLQNRIQDTINQLVSRRRYVMSALLRPMGTYVRRVRTNLERLQTRVNQLQAAAASTGGNTTNRPSGGFVDAAAIDTIRRRIEDISKRISDIVNRIRFSLTPTSAPLNNNGRK